MLTLCRPEVAIALCSNRSPGLPRARSRLLALISNQRNGIDQWILSISSSHWIVTTGRPVELLKMIKWITRRHSTLFCFSFGVLSALFRSSLKHGKEAGFQKSARRKESQNVRGDKIWSDIWNLWRFSFLEHQKLLDNSSSVQRSMWKQNLFCRTDIGGFACDHFPVGKGLTFKEK